MATQTEEGTRQDLFAAALSHELKRPLAAIQAASWSLRRNLETALLAAGTTSRVPGAAEEVLTFVCESLQARSEVPRLTGLQSEQAIREVADHLQRSGLAEHHAGPAARIIVEGGWESRTAGILDLLAAWGAEQVLPVLEAAGKLGSNLRALDESATRLSRIVRAFRDGLEGPEGDRSCFPLKGCLEEALSAVSHEASGEARLELHCPDEVRMIGHAPRLQQAVANLAGNALAALPAAGGIVRVEATVEGDEVRIAVEDNGAGIPVEVRDRLFKPFFTTRPEAGGTGLGLFIARRIVENHGGTLEFTSEPGRTRFEARFPAGSKAESR